MKTVIGKIIPYKTNQIELAYTDHSAGDVLVKYKTDNELLGDKQKQNLTTEINLLSGLITELSGELEEGAE